MLFFYYGIGEGVEPTEDKQGATIGGDSIFGQIALMRTKLHLTDAEIMEKSWIALKLEMGDLPYYDYKATKKVRVPVAETGASLEKLLKKK